MAERTWRATQARGVKQTHEHHHQRPAADAGRSSIGWCRTGCAAPRSRSTATSTRTIACVRCAAARAPSTASSRTSAASIGKTRISIGGNFDESSADSFSGLLDFLKAQDFADKLVKVNFKPVVRSEPAKPKGMLALTPVGRERQAARRLVHDGRRRRRRIDLRQLLLPRREDGAAPGGDPASRVLDVRRRAHGPLPRAPQQRPHDRPGRIALRLPGLHGRKGPVDRPHRRQHRLRGGNSNRKRFDTLDPWKACGDCAFIPVCAGGCLTASYAQLGDMNMPTCHKASFESAVSALAHNVASAN